jgi:hypothetical protein
MFSKLFVLASIDTISTLNISRSDLSVRFGVRGTI